MPTTSKFNIWKQKTKNKKIKNKETHTRTQSFAHLKTTVTEWERKAIEANDIIYPQMLTRFNELPRIVWFGYTITEYNNNKNS